jgi:hypothetical protein
MFGQKEKSITGMSSNLLFIFNINVATIAKKKEPSNF